MVPNVNAVVYDGPGRTRILLQRRDKPGEPVRGRWELPGGRWRAGEAPDAAIVREIAEETGVRITAVSAAIERTEHEPHIVTLLARPLLIIVGVEGTYPALQVVFECYGEGAPRPLPGETADPRWWAVADVKEAVTAQPEEFIAGTAAVLRAVLG